MVFHWSTARRSSNVHHHQGLRRSGLLTVAFGLLTFEEIKMTFQSVLYFILLCQLILGKYVNVFFNRPNPASFCLFSFVSHDKYITITINEKSIDDMLGTRTRGSMMVGSDKSTELWLHPRYVNVCAVS